MPLSNDLISQFVKATNDNKKTTSETTVYGTIHKNGTSAYVRIDGSEINTPITYTANVEDGDRVTVMIKNHTATVTGNLTSPAPRIDDVTDSSKISELEVLIADKVSTADFSAQIGRIDYLVTDVVSIRQTLSAYDANISNLQADNVTINKKLTAQSADISDLQSNKLDTDVAIATYADINLANITKAAMEHFYSESGLIKNVTISNGTIVGDLTGVKISGDLITANTIAAEKLVIKGDDGLYYKLNAYGTTVEAEQTNKNSLDGSVIKAKSIVASKMDVDDLVAFDATIGGFNITTKAIHSGVKSAVNNTTRGIYLDNDGQIAFGDATNYVKFYKNTDGVYKLALAADTIIFDSKYLKWDEDGNLTVNSGAIDMNGTWGDTRMILDSSNIQSYDGTIRLESLRYNNDKGSFINSRTGGGFDFWFTSGGMRICFDGTNGRIWRVTADGSWTALTS